MKWLNLREFRNSEREFKESIKFKQKYEVNGTYENFANPLISLL